MKKKVIGLMLVGLLAIGSLVSAASLWGSYKGKDIIRLTVDGVPTKVSDAPAVSMDGRTMVPIYLLQQAGIKYTWDQKNQTVDIRKPVTSPKSDSDVININRIAYIKDLSSLAGYYQRLESLGSVISATGESLSFAFEAKNMGNPGNYLEQANKTLNDSIDTYNETLEFSQQVLNRVTKNNLNVNDGNSALNLYFDAIDEYKLAYEYMEKFYSSNTQHDFNTYLQHSSKGFDLTIEGRTIAMDNYFTYMDYVQQY